MTGRIADRPRSAPSQNAPTPRQRSSLGAHSTSRRPAALSPCGLYNRPARLPRGVSRPESLFQPSMKIIIASDAKQPNATYRPAPCCGGSPSRRSSVVTRATRDPGAFDGLLLAGGADAAPSLYGEAPPGRRLSEAPSRAGCARLPSFRRGKARCAGLRHLPRAPGAERGAWRHAMAGPVFPAGARRPYEVGRESARPKGPSRAHVVRARPAPSPSRFAAAVAALRHVRELAPPGRERICAPGLVP